MNKIKLLNINEVSKSEYDYFFSLMNEEKKARVARFRFEADKKRTVCAELLARKMIFEFCNIPPEEIKFLTDENGKPYAENAGAEFNVSHSGELVLCAVSDKPVGVDIEKIISVSDKVIHSVCSKEEEEFIFSAEADEKEKRFIEIWTAKEAYLKCKGTGIKEIKSVNTFDKEIKKHLKTYFEADYIYSIYNQ